MTMTATTLTPRNQADVVVVPPPVTEPTAATAPTTKAKANNNNNKVKNRKNKKKNSYNPKTPTRLGGAFSCFQKKQSSSTTSNDNNNTTTIKEVVVPLLRLEEKCYAVNGSPISTLTWFEGDHKAAAKLLQQKMQDILVANPWLTGRVVKQRGRGGGKKKLVLVHPEQHVVMTNGSKIDNDTEDESTSSSSSSDDETDSYHHHRYTNHNDDHGPPSHFVHITNPKKSSLHRGIAIEETADLCKPFLVRNGPNELLWKVTVVPCWMAPNKYFAVVDSMSHVISDGHTYYNIHNMLMCCDDANNTTTTIRPLRADRIFDTVQLQKEALGDEEYGLFDSAGFLAGIISGVVKSTIFAPLKLAPKIQKRYFLVDNDKLKEEKVAAVSGNNDSDNDGVSFVSTNDVLTSWFFRKSKCSYGLMVMNFRNRLQGHEDDHAGNYENSLFYYPPDFASPRLIRKSLTAMAANHNDRNHHPSWKRSVTMETTTTPSAWKHVVNGRFALVSNWASFAQNSDLPDCKEALHIPLFVKGKHPLPNNLCVGIIFRAGPGKTAMYVVGNSKVVRGLDHASFESDERLQ